MGGLEVQHVQTLIGWFLAMSVTGVLLLGVTAVGTAAIDDARAGTAADAAALAGAAGGVDAANEAARRNGADVASFSVRGQITTVVVQVGEARATAHAERVEIIERP